MNLHGGRQLAAPTPKQGGQTATPKARGNRVRTSNLLTQAFKVAHQRVNLDVDLGRKLINGFTELTLVPLSSSLRVLRLDAREMRIKNIYINGSPCTNYIHRDLLYINDPKVFEDCVASKSVNLWDVYSTDFTIHQHHLIRQKLNYIFGDLIADQYAPEKLENTNTEELRIILPDNLKIELADQGSFHTPASLMPTAGLTPLHMRTKNTHSDGYAPLQLGIEYETINPKNGLNFVCDSNSNKKFWHAYTVNSEYNISTSSWVPCIDNLWERNTWSIEMSIPRSTKNLNDLLVSAPQRLENGEDHMEIDSEPNADATENMNGHDKDESLDEEEDDGEEDEDEDYSENYDLFVCTGDSNNTKETPHPTDLSKKVVSWSVFNPVCAHHVGWAVGSFQSSELSNFNDGLAVLQPQEDNFEEYDEIEKDESTASVMLYYLPGQEDLAKNTCIFAHKAIEFFLKEFGSFPFTSYSIAFVTGPSYPYNNFAGLSLLSESLLYPPDVIEPMFDTTEGILECIAGQWSSINIVPQFFNDLWCTIGIAKFMTFQFMRILMGLNQQRYQMKQKMDRIVREDSGKDPLGLLSLSFPVSESDFEFVRLKAPVILYILDHRMTKTDKSFGLSRVLPKIFLQAMSGDLQNGTLSTQHFQYVCEKVNRNRLESFFKQWVYGTGTPIFNITQRFNKKRSMIEVVIRQAQAHMSKVTHPRLDTFLGESLNYLNDRPAYPIQSTFLGPMTIRVHEGDGTPYEHIVDIKDSVVKFDVQYNTKFKRLKKSKEESSEGNPVFAKLGDVLESEADVKEWKFEEWPKRDEEFLDPFEWIRVDTDFEWIATFNVKQPDYMFASQLQQDRDVEAQIASIEYFGNQEKPSDIYFTTLTRTLMDERYFYGVRIAAAKALAETSRQSNGFAGLSYLITAFKKLFCYEDSLVPKSNNFDDFGRLFLQKAFPKIMSSVRDDEGNTPAIVKNLLFSLLKYNDNSNNDFQDCFYVCDIVDALTEAVVLTSLELKSFDYHLQREHLLSILSEDQSFIDKVLLEINRIQKLDTRVPSYQFKVSQACVKQKIRLARHGLIDFSFESMLILTSKKYSSEIRVLAFKGLFLLGGLKNTHVMKYFLDVCLLEDNSPFFKTNLINALSEAISETAIHGAPSMYDDPEFQSLEKIFEASDGLSNQTNLVVIEETQTAEMSSRRDAIARATIKGTIEILRRDLSIGNGLQETLWELLHSSLLSLLEKRMIFMLCGLLYAEEDSFPVSISVPCVPFEELKKKIVAKNLGEGMVIIKREGRFKILLSTKILLSLGKAKSDRKEYGDKAVVSLSRNTRTRSNVAEPEVEVIPEPKLKLKLSSVPAAKPPTAKPVVPEVPPPVVQLQPAVTRDTSNSMSLKISFKKHKLLPLKPVEPQESPSLPITVDSSTVKIKFSSSHLLERYKTLVLPKRYVRISTRRGRVSLSSTPFPESNQDSQLQPVKEEQQIELSNGISEASAAETLKEKAATPSEVKVEEKTDEIAAPEVNGSPNNAEKKKSLPLSRHSSEIESLSHRSKSPFSPEPSPGHTPGHTKRKKTKIYIHGKGSQVLSSKSNSPKQSSSNPEIKNEDSDKPSDVQSEKPSEKPSDGPSDKTSEKPAEKPRPKLKLKLNLR